MPDPVLTELVAPKLTIAGKEYSFEMRPRDILPLRTKYNVDVLDSKRRDELNSVETLATILAVTSHDPELTPDMIMDGVRIGPIIRTAKLVLENAMAGEAPSPQ